MESEVRSGKLEERSWKLTKRYETLGNIINYLIKMHKFKIVIIGFVVIISLFTFSCKNDQPKEQPKTTPEVTISVPDFNQDSAFSYVKAQVDFGPRVPNTKAHQNCAQYFVNKFESYGAKVYVQEFKARAFDGKTLNGKNIIASINPDAAQRVLLCAHWDSRPFADHDPDVKNHYTPIDGANDGAAGVGILMEIVRLMAKNTPKIGVDIVLFDIEDYGQHNDIKAESDEDTWALGSLYWSQQPHIPGYTARYGILLDMVGAKNPTFHKELYSMSYASGIVEKVWFAAAKLGYGQIFLDQRGGQITDDHVNVNKYAKIPTIDIIHYVSSSQSSFYPYWHTVKDKLDQIDPASLKLVGQTLLQVVYEEK
jgi:hypothetical protein